MRVVWLSMLAACSFSSPGGAAIDAPPGSGPDGSGSGSDAAPPHDAPPGVQMTMDFPVTEDTDADAQLPDSTNGTRTTMLARGGGTPCIALWRVDLSTIPRTAAVDAAELHLVTSQTTGDPVSVFAMLEDWDELLATFNNRKPTIAWSGAGVTPPSRESTASAGPIDASQSFSPRVAPLAVPVVARWVSQPDQNFGAAIVMPTTSSATFRTRNDTTVANRPFLRVTFTAP